jgi:hypothetical protein
MSFTGEVMKNSATFMSSSSLLMRELMVGMSYARRRMNDGAKFMRKLALPMRFEMEFMSNGTV